MLPAGSRRQELIELLKETYDLRSELEQRLPVTVNDPLENRKLRLDLQKVKQTIRQFETELEKLEAAPVELAAPVVDPLLTSEIGQIKAEWAALREQLRTVISGAQGDSSAPGAGLVGESRRLRVFLCHSKADKVAVRKLFRKLKEDGLEPWFDEENLLPGQRWQYEIPRAVRTSDIVLVCLSPASINKEGYIQKELSFALDVAEKQPEGAIYIIPVRMMDCEVPPRLSDFQWVNYYQKLGYKRLLLSLKLRAEALGLKLTPLAALKSPDRKKRPQIASDASAVLAIPGQVPEPSPASQPASMAARSGPDPGLPAEAAIVPSAPLKPGPYASFRANPLVPYLEGMELKDQGKFKEAIARFDMAIKADPTHSSYYFQRGFAYYGLSDFEHAIADFNAALELAPGDPLLYVTRGLVYSEVRQNEAALADFNQALQLQPDNPHALNERGIALKRLKRYEQAIQDFNRAIELNPDFFMAYNNRGRTFYDLKQYRQALQDFDRAIELNSGVALTYYNRGMAYKVLGDTTLAQQNFLKGAELGDQASKNQLRKMGRPKS